MTFKTEEIPPEERYRLKGITGPFSEEVYDNVNTVRRWTIDRQRDAFLVCSSRTVRPNIPFFYTLSWKGKTVDFKTVEREDGNMYRPEGLDVYRRIMNFYPPDYFRAQRDDVLRLAKEAFGVYGCAGYGENVRVHLEFYNTESGKATPWN